MDWFYFSRTFTNLDWSILEKRIFEKMQSKRSNRQISHDLMNQNKRYHTSETNRKSRFCIWCSASSTRPQKIMKRVRNSVNTETIGCEDSVSAVKILQHGQNQDITMDCLPPATLNSDIKNKNIKVFDFNKMDGVYPIGTLKSVIFSSFEKR